MYAILCKNELSDILAQIQNVEFSVELVMYMLVIVFAIL